MLCVSFCSAAARSTAQGNRRQLKTIVPAAEVVLLGRGKEEAPKSGARTAGRPCTELRRNPGLGHFLRLLCVGQYPTERTHVNDLNE